MDVEYRPDREGMRALGLSKEMGDAMVAAAEVGRAAAEADAPFVSGSYRSAFTVERAVLPAGYQHEDRAGAILANNSDHAIPVEQKHHTLARAVDAIERGA